MSFAGLPLLRESPVGDARKRRVKRLSRFVEPQLESHFAWLRRGEICDPATAMRKRAPTGSRSNTPRAARRKALEAVRGCILPDAAGTDMRDPTCRRRSQSSENSATCAPNGMRAIFSEWAQRCSVESGELASQTLARPAS